MQQPKSACTKANSGQRLDLCKLKLVKCICILIALGINCWVFLECDLLSYDMWVSVWLHIVVHFSSANWRRVHTIIFHAGSPAASDSVHAVSSVHLSYVCLEVTWPVTCIIIIFHSKIVDWLFYCTAHTRRTTQ